MGQSTSSTARVKGARPTSYRRTRAVSHEASKDQCGMAAFALSFPTISRTFRALHDAYGLEQSQFEGLGDESMQHSNDLQDFRRLMTRSQLRKIILNTQHDIKQKLEANSNDISGAMCYDVIEEKDLDALMERADLDGSRSISFKEFLVVIALVFFMKELHSETVARLHGDDNIPDTSDISRSSKFLEDIKICETISAIIRDNETDYPLLTVICDPQTRKAFKVLGSAWRKCDPLGNGYITSDSLKHFLFNSDTAESNPRNLEIMVQRFKELDFDDDGAIDLPEFVFGICEWVGLMETEEAVDVAVDKSSPHEQDGIELKTASEPVSVSRVIFTNELGEVIPSSSVLTSTASTAERHKRMQAKNELRRKLKAKEIAFHKHNRENEQKRKQELVISPETSHISSQISVADFSIGNLDSEDRSHGSHSQSHSHSFKSNRVGIKPN